jgi:ABC-type uncharacterized transport system involved in gliding motility auxiliary subunit
MQRRLLILATSLGCVLLLVSASVIARALLGGVRVDMTEEKLYTLSEGTKKLLGELKEPIRARFFYSAKEVSGIPALQAYAERVKTLLNVYAGLSKGKFSVEAIDPEPFSQEEDDAVAFGVDPVPTDQSGTQLYFGLALHNTTDDVKAFPFMNPEREQFLEYDVTRAVYDLSLAKKPKIAIMGGIDFTGGAEDAPFLPGAGGRWTIIDYIKDEFDATVTEKGAKTLLAGTDVLVWAYPDMPEEAITREVDAFVANGGKLLLLLDPYPEWGLGRPGSDGLKRLLDHWGLAYAPDMVALDADHSARSGVRQEGMDGTEGEAREIYLDKPNWILLDKAQLNADNPATANLRQLFFKSPGHIVFDEESKEAKAQSLRWTPLAWTGEGAAEVSKSGADDTEALLRDYAPGGKALTLAGQLTGAFTTAFPENGKPSSPSGRQGAVAVIADTDVLHDSTWLNKQRFLGHDLHVQISDNGPFVLNALEGLTGGDVLSSLRGRSQIQRPFDTVNSLRRKAEREFLDKQEELQERLRNAQDKLSELRRADGEGEGVVTAEEQREAAAFKQELLQTRAELRQVQHSLRKDIESLGGILKFIHIGLIPALVALLGFFLPGRIGARRNG